MLMSGPVYLFNCPVYLFNITWNSPLSTPPQTKIKSLLTTTKDGYRYTQLQELMTPPGIPELYNSTCQESSKEQQQLISLSPSSSSITLVSEDEDGYLPSPHPQAATYWAMTTWTEKLSTVRVINILKSMGKKITSVYGSQEHICPKSSESHHHWLIKLNRHCKISVFPPVLRNDCWLHPVVPTGGDTLRESVQKYINYIKGKGPNVIQFGDDLNKLYVDQKRKKNEEIMDQILKGTRCSELCKKYPAMIANVYKMARFRPPRKHRTDLVYYYGPPGTGKTTMIHTVLKTIYKVYNIDFYCKLGGLAKFWDGYDNEPICWIDDPVTPSATRTGDEEPIQRLKTVISTGDVLVEVKHGTMVFDSSLIIISSNIDPEDMARSSGPDNQAAMYRRFTDTCGAHFIGTEVTARNRLPVHLVRIICANLEFNHNMEIDVETVISNIPKLKFLSYSKIPALEHCNVSEYVDVN